MRVKEITNKKIWEDFLKEIDQKTFLHSWNWGEFQKRMGEKIWRLGVYEKGSNLERETKGSEDQSEYLAAVCLVIKITAKRGNFLLVPHGPIIRSKVKSQKSKILQALLDQLKEIARREKTSFIRISPIWERTEENIKIFKKLGFRKAPIHIHPEATWQLDIRASQEELLKNMRKTTRYLIRKAQKDKDIEIIQSQQVRDIEVFSRLHKEVSLRQHFVPFSLEYLTKEFLAFQPDNEVSLFMGKYKGEVIASAFVIFYSGKGFYHHAALLKKYPTLPIAYLILWEAIKEAKRRGCSFFDFWGYVSPKENPKHPWAGPTLFKMGFGGEKKEYVKTQDFPTSLFYWIDWIIEKIRKIKRRV